MIRFAGPVVLLLLGVALLVTGNEVFVSPSGADSPTCGASTTPCATLGQALLLVTDEGTVTLQNGTFTGAGNVGVTVGPVGVTIQSTESALIDLSSLLAGTAAIYCTSDLQLSGLTFANLAGDGSAVLSYDGTGSSNVTLDVVSFNDCSFTDFTGSFDLVTTVTAQPCTTSWNSVTFTNLSGDWAVVECDASTVEGVCIGRADALSFNYCTSTRASIFSVSCSSTYLSPQLVGTLTASSSSFATLLELGRYCQMSVSGAEITDCLFSAPIIDSASPLVEVFASTVSGSQALNGTGPVPFLRISSTTDGGLVTGTLLESVSMIGNFGISLVFAELACSESGFCQELDSTFTMTDIELFSNNFPAVEEGEPPFAMVHIANMTHVYISDFVGKENHQEDNDGIIVRVETYSNSNVTINLSNMQFDNNTVVPMGLGLAAYGAVTVQMSKMSFTANNNRQATFGIIAEDFVIVEASMQNVNFTNNNVGEADDDGDIVLDSGVLYCANGKSQAAVTLDLVSNVNFDGNNSTSIVNEDCVLQCGESISGLCDNAEDVDSNEGLDITIFVIVVVSVGMVLTIAVIVVVVYIREKHAKAREYAEVGDYNGAVLVDEEEEGTVVY